jgi:hypothetical protein
VIGRRIMKISNPGMAVGDIVAAGFYFVSLYDLYLAGDDWPEAFRQAHVQFDTLGFDEIEVGAALMLAERILDAREFAAVSDRVQ